MYDTSTKPSQSILNSDQVPFVSAMVMYFIEPPTVDFHLTKSASFGNHPLLVRHLKQIVKDSMSTQLVEPQRIVIPLAISDASGISGE